MNSIIKLSVTGILLAASATSVQAAEQVEQATAKPEDVVQHYATVAHAVFEDALITARHLEKKIDVLIEEPSKENLETARQAWKNARVPYQQSEVFRFGNPNVDEWEGQLNAWPLDEGLIDYVDAGYEHEMGNPGAQANIIASDSIKVGQKEIDLKKITPELLASLNELAGSEANVATGYHAIEFLLWGQDLNGTTAGAGERPYTDFVQGKECTNGHCERRVEFLQAAVDLLIQDLADMTEQWAPDQKDNYRATLTQLPAEQGLQRILYGMGSLSLGELAGERMKVALDANSAEDEHDCFSDNTHFSHFYNAKGVSNVYTGTYQRVGGKTVKGASLSDLVLNKDASVDHVMKSALSATENKLQRMVDLAESANPMKFDQMIAPNNKVGATVVQESIAALVDQAGAIEKVAATVGIKNLNPDTADHSF